MGPIRIAQVDTSSARGAGQLYLLQVRILDADVPHSIDEGYWWLGYDKGQAVCFAGMVKSSRWSDAGYLCRSGVLDAYRGRGLQKRLIRVRERKARELGWNWLMSDTRDNPASANSLIACGYRVYHPTRPWGHDDATYWRKRL